MKYEAVTPLTPKIRFPMLKLCLMSFAFRKQRGKTGTFLSLSLNTYFIMSWNFALNLNHADKTSLETIWYNQD